MTDESKLISLLNDMVQSEVQAKAKAEQKLRNQLTERLEQRSEYFAERIRTVDDKSVERITTALVSFVLIHYMPDDDKFYEFMERIFTEFGPDYGKVES